MNSRIEALRKKLASKGDEVIEVQREAEKHRLMADKLQVTWECDDVLWWMD